MFLALVMMAPAAADQCSWISEAHASAALEHLQEGAQWLSYCEPCGETEPTLSTIGRATMAPVSGGRYYQVSIDGKAIDLAYTFFRANPGDAWFTNLAKAVDCQASGVSRKVTWPPSTDQSERLKSWLGTYQTPKTRLVITQFFDDPNGLGIQLDHPTSHDSGAATFELVSYVDVDGDPLSFATPFGSCRVRLSRGQGTVQLTPTAACAGLLDDIAGTYRGG